MNMQAKALYKCTADDKGELSFEENDIIIDVTESKEEGWFEGRVQGTSVRGLFPFNYVEFIPEQQHQQQQQQQSLTPSKAIPLNNSSSETSARTLFSSSVSPPNSTLSSTWSVISNKDSSLSSQDNHNGTAPADIITPSFISRTGTDKGSDAFDRVMAMQPPVIINKPPGGTTVVSKLAGLDNIQQQPRPSIAPKPTQLLKKKPSIGNKNPTSTNTLATERLPTQPPIAPLTNSTSPSVASRVRSLSISASGTNSRPENTAPVKLPSLYNKPNSNNTISPLIKTTAAAIDTDNNSNSNKPDNKNISRKALPIIQPKSYTGSTKSTTAHNNRPMLKQPEKVMFDNNPVNEHEEDVEDVDGYQLVRPSQIRQRQAQGSTMITPKAMPTLARVNLKQSTNSNILLSKQSDNISSSSSSSSLPSKSPFSSLPSSSSGGFSSSSNKDNKRNLDGIPGARNPAPRLPSRPVSKAGRRSRSSKMMSTAVAASPEPVATISNRTKLPPPGPKPKPSQFSTIASDAATETSNSPSQRSKGRSISNPPPIQPKPFISKSINISNNNNNHTKPDIPPTQNKPEGIIKKQSPTPQASTATTLKTTPAVPARPGTIEHNQQWQQQQKNQSDDSNNNSNTEDTNVKPSEILMRTRSKSNGWTQPTSKYNNNVPVLPARSAAQKTETTAVVAIAPAKKTPPPPPPSRPVQRQQNGPTTTGVPIRYEELFNAINDKGYVDGETTKIIWQRSKVADELLAKIWQQCDPQGSGLLDKNAFIQGMREIDAILESSM